MKDSAIALVLPLTSEAEQQKDQFSTNANLHLHSFEWNSRTTMKRIYKRERDPLRFKLILPGLQAQ